MIRHSLFITLLFFAANMQAQNLYVTQSSVSFQIKNAGITVDGTLGGLTANIVFNAQKPEAGSIAVVLSSETINTGNAARDKHLKKEDYFHVTAYPQISISSVNLSAKGGNQFTGRFKLKIRDKEKLIDIPFTYANQTFEAVFTINRLDFGVGGSSFILADNVTVTVKMVVKP